MSDQPVINRRRSVSKRQHSTNEAPQIVRVSRFGNELGCAQCPSVARIELVALAGKDDDPGFRRMGEDVGNQGEAFIRPVRGRWQAQVDQRESRGAFLVAQQRNCLGARGGSAYRIVAAKKIAQRVGDQRVIVDNQQFGFAVGRSQGWCERRAS